MYWLKFDWLFLGSFLLFLWVYNEKYTQGAYLRGVPEVFFSNNLNQT